MGCLLGDGAVVAVEEMADAGIATNEDELLCCLALAEGFQQPEHAFHGHVHDGFGDFLAGGEMHDMGDACHGALDIFTVRDVAFDNFYPVGFGDQSIVTQGANFCAVPARLRENVRDEICADFAGCTCYQEAASQSP